jgi:glycosyltransferase involved in cell wall biosynthesis
MRIAIVCTYFQRQFQLNKTLLSIAKSSHKDFEVIIVDDCSPDDIILPEVDFKVTVIKMKDKTWTNPEPAYNIGIIEALKGNPDIIILQNAECYHEGDILTNAQRITSENYISFGCYCLNEETTFKEHNISEVIQSSNIGAVDNGQNAWYNHPVFRPVGYDFCSAITADNLRKLNGYDERFSLGCAYGDDYLIERVRMLGLKIEITEYPFVVHQWHYSNPGHPDHELLCKRNAELLKQLVPENKYKAIHLMTPDL